MTDVPITALTNFVKPFNFVNSFSLLAVPTDLWALHLA